MTILGKNGGLRISQNKFFGLRTYADFEKFIRILGVRISYGAVRYSNTPTQTKIV